MYSGLAVGVALAIPILVGLILIHYVKENLKLLWKICVFEKATSENIKANQVRYVTE